MGPLEWLRKLETELEARQEDILLYEDYYNGLHEMAFATSKFRETFGNLFREFADNWCPLIVNASAERMNIEGFQFGTEERADEDAWKLFLENYLDEESDIAHVEAIKLGTAYLIVDPQGPTVTVEHPSQVVVMYKAGSRRERAAALKKWYDEDSGFVYATVYLPEGVYKFQSEEEYNQLSLLAGAAPTWVARDGFRFFTPNRFGKIIPVIPLRNSPSLLEDGLSDLAEIIPIQDAINKLLSDMIVASEYAAFRQRWATGIEVPVDPDTGEEMEDDKFVSFVGRIWATEEIDAKFGEFEVTDLRNYVQAIEMLIQHLAARTRTPPHYLLGQSGAFPSGESLKSTETGLVAKTRAKSKTMGGGWAEAMRLALIAWDGKDRGRGRTLWGDPESRTVAEQVDAALKEKDLGVPLPEIWRRRLGASPEEVVRWERALDKQTADIMAAALAGIRPDAGGFPGGTTPPVTETGATQNAGNP